MTAVQALGREWEILQQDCERYERGALWIKLFAVGLAGLAMAPGANAGLICLLLAVLWLQEAIFRTSQSRLGSRILQIEALLQQQSAADGAGYQLHSQWLAQRPGVTGLLREYARSALRPTVAFPYPVLMLAAGIVTLN